MTLVTTASLRPFSSLDPHVAPSPRGFTGSGHEIQSVSSSRAAVFVIGAGVLDFREKLRHQQSRKVLENLPVVNTIVEALDDFEERQRGCSGLCHRYVIQHGVHSLLASSLTRSVSANSQDGVECDLILWH